MPYPPPSSPVVNAECIIYDRVCERGRECATSSLMVNTPCADGSRQLLDAGVKTGSAVRSSTLGKVRDLTTHLGVEGKGGQS